MEAFLVFRALHILSAALWAGAGLYRVTVAEAAPRLRHATYMVAIGGATVLFGFGILGSAKERYTPEALGDGFMLFNIAMSLALLALGLAAGQWWFARRDEPGKQRLAKRLDHGSLGCILGALALMLAFRL